MNPSRHARAIVLGTLALTTTALVTPVAWPHKAPTRFCTADLAFIEYAGGTVATEDQGEPGRGECDGTIRSGGERTLGFDCKIRAFDGTVLETIPPNRSDGMCGLPDR